MSFAASIRGRISRAFVESVYDNPVVAKELRTRMRGRKAFIVMGAYVVLLTGILLFRAYFLWMDVNAGGSSVVNRNIGMELFTTLVWTQTVLLTLVIPALTSGAITGELESRTIEMLALTRLRPGKIVLGKVLSGVLYSLVLLVSSMPVAGICTALGGVSPAEVAVNYLLLFGWVILFSCMGVFWSSLFSKTAASTLLTYGFALGYFLITMVACGQFMSYSHYGGGTSSNAPALIGLNPGFSPECGMLRSSVCGLHIPVSGVAFVLHVALGLVFLLTAVMHVKHHRSDKSLPIRLLVMLISAAIVWLILGNERSASTWTMSMPGGATPLALADEGGTAIFVMILMGLCAVIFATGPVRTLHKRSGVTSVLSLRRMFAADMRGAMPFMMLWTAVVFLAMGVTFFWASKAYHAHLPVSFWDVSVKLGVTGLAVTMGISALGILLSSITNVRRNAAALLILALIVIFAGAPIINANYQAGVSNPNSPAWQLSALWPLLPAWIENGQWGQYSPHLWWPLKSSWLVTSFWYILITLIALSLSHAAARKYGGVEEDE